MSIGIDPGAGAPDQPWARQRRDYALGGLAEADAPQDPLELFRHWHADATRARLPEPNAMVLATVSADGQPSSRMVLLRGLTDRAYVFFTNQASRKGQDLAANDRCALLFPWHGIERQVRVEGMARSLDREAVAAYFHSRPRGAQCGAWASRQSRPIDSRDDLERAQAEAEKAYEDLDVIPVPDDWGGYAITPSVIEFWQGRANRLHDRLVYQRDGSEWSISRLQP